jgi:hypothetical protein
MAMVEDAIIATYEFLDSEGGKSTVDAILPAPFPAVLADAFFYFDAVGDALQALSDCNLTHYNLRYQYSEDALPAPTVGIEVENVLRLGIESVGADTNYITLPGMDTASPVWVVGQEDTANLDNAALAAYITSLIDGNGTITPVDERNDDLVASGTTPGGNDFIPLAVKYHRRSQVRGGGRRG